VNKFTVIACFGMELELSEEEKKEKIPTGTLLAYSDNV
jgi:hypothetical protein